MNLKYLPMRVELSLWHFVIGLLTESRGIQSLLAWIINDLTPHLTDFTRTFNWRRALGWIASGVAISIFLGLGNNSPFQDLAVPGFATLPLSPPTTGQRNLLAIGIDDSSSPAPRLESVWLVSYFPGQSTFTLVPIYPDILEKNSSDLEALIKNFSLDENGTPNQAFFDLLGRETWWNNYFVIDEVGWAAIQDFLGGGIPNGQLLDDSGAPGFLPLWDNRFASVRDQTALLQAACLRAATLRQEDAIQGLSLLAPHLRSDLDLTQTPQDWSAEPGSRLGLRCEFPLTNPFEP